MLVQKSLVPVLVTGALPFLAVAIAMAGASPARTALAAPIQSDLAGTGADEMTRGTKVDRVRTPDDEGPVPGDVLYERSCADCHDRSVYKAPSRASISRLDTRSLVRVMEDGVMRSQAAHLDQEGLVAIAEYLTGERLSEVPRRMLPPDCGVRHAFDPGKPPVSTGWGVDLHNSRFQPDSAGGISAGNISELEIKWVFAYPNAFQARSEPVYGGGAVYVGSQDGTVWALDAETGCLRWRFQATAEVRTGIVISPWSSTDEAVDPLVYFGDTLANTYAVSARTGELRWKIKADDHPHATSTGTPTLSGDRLYVPVSSLEVVAAADPTYECCNFRGVLLAVDAETGETIWKSPTTDRPAAPVGRNDAGAAILAPSGAPIWSSPTVDPERGLVYVATGQNYSSPADGNSDAIIAYDSASGDKVWVSQQTASDAWNVACYTSIPGVSNVNCPEEDGPDYDFGSHTILVERDSGEQVLVGGQKSGHAVGVDPDTGATLWRTRVGRGGIQGGVHFGIAAQGHTVYVPINDLVYPIDDARYGYDMKPRPGVHAVDAADGTLLWSTPAPDVCGDTEFCDPGVSQAVTAVPGAVIAGHLDGRLRAYAREDGELIWQKNLLGEYDSVSGEVATGGAFSGGGVLVANGLVYVNAGYGYNNHIPGNALIVLGLPDAGVPADGAQ